MLPATESENPDTMQTGELERAAPEEAPPHASMTVTRDSPQPHNLLPPPLVATSTEYKFQNETDTVEPLSSDIEDSTTELDVSPRPSLSSRNNIYHPIDSSQFRNESLHNKFHEQNPNESVRSWLQRITAMQHEIQRKHKIQTSMEYQHIKSNSTNLFVQQPSATAPAQSSRVVKYQDLPYMGEMTLDNSKPRRGRKPKKADICHLIYKNYGTIFPGTPKSFVGTQNEVKKVSPKSPKEQQPTEPNQKTNVQNRIISSLLEKRLTQESLRNKELLLSSSTTKTIRETSVSKSKNNDQDEPLNLCIRDLNQLKIRLLRKHGNVYASDTTLNEVKSEPVSDDDVEFVNESPSPVSVSVIKPPELSPSSEIESPLLDPKSPDLTAPGGYVYWPNAGVFIHPVALHSHLMYYQRMAANNNYTLPNNTPRTQSETPPTPRDSPTNREKEVKKSLPKHVTRSPQNKSLVEEIENPVVLDSRMKRVATQGGNAPTKRKRSAIFIPPIPAENQTNPATEVSICKFKFTGGAKPSLQEKKMLSVDSGGNFRYYSGTGDKSMRGYEFFPRETLQQQAAAGSSHGSGTGAFLQASGEKIPMIPSSCDQKAVPDFMFSPETSLQPMTSMQELGTTRHRKRKTRKSLQREKLEQTFKEKGFLIQTQQLESAEGATYCKFRQLRKFTRYLFRSWKDYLPGSVRELQDGEKSEEEDVEAVDDAQVIESRINSSDFANM